MYHYSGQLCKIFNTCRNVSYTQHMIKHKRRNILFTIILVISYIVALGYLVFLSPTQATRIYGELSPGVHTYWVISGVIYVSTLIGVTFWKRIAVYPFLAIVALDAIVALVLLHSIQDVALNCLLAAAWAVVIRQHWRYFE